MTASGSLKAKVAKGAMWVVLEQFVVQGLNFGMGVLLARLLGPEAFGTVALVTIFIAVAQVLAISGLGQALVQKADVDERDFDAVFCASLSMAAVLYLILFFLAPAIAQFYRVAELTAIVRVLALNLFCFSFNSVQNAALFRKMRFDVTFRVAIATSVVSAVAGVGMAFCGYGVWSLVCSSLLSNVAGVVARMFYIDWHPRFRCDKARLRPLFSFGWKLMASSLLSTLVANINGVVIGRFFTKADLAFVNRGKNIPEMIGTNVRTSLIESSFPVLSQLQVDRERMTAALHRLLGVSMFILFPAMTLLGVVSGRLIPFLYGEQWNACVPYAQLICVANLLWTVTSVNSTVLMAFGRSDWLLKLSICMKVVSLTVMCVCLPFGVLPWMIVGTFVTGPIAVVLHVLLVRRQLDFGFRAQFRDVLPAFLLTLSTVPAVVAVGTLPIEGRFIGNLIVLMLQGIVAATVYLGLAVVFRVTALCEILKIVSPRLPTGWRTVRWLKRRFGID